MAAARNSFATVLSPSFAGSVTTGGVTNRGFGRIGRGRTGCIGVAAGVGAVMVGGVTTVAGLGTTTL